MTKEMNVYPTASQGYKLKLRPKKLSSGRCQVKFEVRTATYSRTTTGPTSAYGYYLAEPGATLKEVVEKIRERLASARNKDRLYHDNLYHLQRKITPQSDFILFSS
ncbi:MAG: hypothetical protein WBH03_06590 [Cyclobacteriaceae bacterium]